MSYTAKRVILIVLAWGLIVFTGLHIQANLNAAPPLPAGPTPLPNEETALQQSLQSDPNDLPALVRLARILYDRKEYEAAGLLYARAVGLQPNSPDLLLQLAATQFYQQKFAEARTTLEQTVKLAPKRADIWLLLGLARSRVTPPDLAAARAAWQQVGTLAPGTALARQAEGLLAELDATPGP